MCVTILNNRTWHKVKKNIVLAMIPFIVRYLRFNDVKVQWLMTSVLVNSKYKVENYINYTFKLTEQTGDVK
jgi:hypothetical protein